MGTIRVRSTDHTTKLCANRNAMGYFYVLDKHTPVPIDDDGYADTKTCPNLRGQRPLGHIPLIRQRGSTYPDMDW
jgi:hypothetical protein